MLLYFASIGYSQTCNTVSPNYTTINSACNSGNFTTNSEWIGNVHPPFTLSAGAYTIPAGVVVDIASSNFQLDYDLIVYGTLLIDGKLAMTNSTNKITVMSGGLVTCCATGYCGSSCASCGASDKIAIGGTNVYCGAGGCGSVHGSFSGFAVLSNSGLPIKLSSFTGEANGSVIDLKWKTESELNFDYIILQKSDNGQDFGNLDLVKGHGTTNIPQNYSAVDSTPVIGANYYRLISVDYDNYTETFTTIAVEYLAQKSVSFSPNPSNGNQIKFNSNFDFVGNINIFDSFGSSVTTVQLNGTTTLLNFVTPLKPGLYVFKVEGQGYNKVFRIVIN